METGKKMSKTTIWVIVAVIILIALVVLYFTVFKKNGAAKRTEKTPEELIDEAMPDAIKYIDSTNKPESEKTAMKGLLPQAKRDILVQWNTSAIQDKTKFGLTESLWSKAQYIFAVTKK